MAPATLMIDPSDDFVMPVSKSVSPPKRTLLLAPPTLASHSSALSSVLADYDRSVTDLQMLDRLSAGLVKLPSSTYDLVLILADASSMLGESLALMNRAVLGPVAEALKPNGRLQSQDGNSLEESTLSKEAVLAGLVASRGGFEKPNYGDNEGAVTLKFGLKKKNQPAPLADGSVPLNLKKKKPVEVKPVVPAGVGFIDLSDDLDDDDLIDEDTLMTEEDLLRPINIRMSIPSQYTCHILLTLHQLLSVSPRPANAVALARTAAAAWPNVLPRRTLRSAPRPTRSSRASSWPPTTLPRSTLPSRARLAHAATARSATLSDATGALTSACRPSSPARRSGCSTTMCNCKLQTLFMNYHDGAALQAY
jgi:hypothetical protein